MFSLNLKIRDPCVLHLCLDYKAIVELTIIIRSIVCPREMLDKIFRF